MDTNKLQVFLQVLDYKNLTKAGENLGYTQSGMTHIINSIENEVGFRLLKRSRSGVSLTSEGERILPYIRDMVSLGNRLDQEIMKIKGLLQGNINIGSYTSFTLYFLPNILREFQQQYPNINIKLMKGNSGDMEKWLEEGAIDIAFISRQPYHSFDFIELLLDPIYAVMSPENPLAQYDPLPISLLNEAPFLRYATPTGVDHDVEKILEELSPKTVFTTNFDYSLISMARQNLGICLVPGLTAENNNEGVVIRALSPPRYRDLGIAVPQLCNASPAVKRFIECIKMTLAAAPA